jgi:hypothetical protein
MNGLLLIMYEHCCWQDYIYFFARCILPAGTEINTRNLSVQSVRAKVRKEVLYAAPRFVIFSLLSNRAGGAFPGVINLTTHSHLVLRFTIRGALPPLSIYPMH